jgi:hypothetical protein
MEVFQVLGNSLWACLLQASTTLHVILPYSARERLLSALGIVTYVSLIPSAPPGFPNSGNGLWYTAPGTIWVKEFLPIGNGHLGGEQCLLIIIVITKWYSNVHSDVTWWYYPRGHTNQHRVPMVGRSLPGSRACRTLKYSDIQDYNVLNIHIVVQWGQSLTFRTVQNSRENAEYSRSYFFKYHRDN